ncbi:hypothetical protein ABZ345_03565 [Lentzea sp. NPDC005914]|uniref:hypothetical protein n=1 Tax=Lentzea sp. NPDC005914 TaxID=3154572 RepID=UPI0033F26190
MSLLSTDSFVVEQPWSAMSLLLRPKYRVEAYDGRDLPLGFADETRRALGVGFLRAMSLSRWTPFHLRAVAADGRTVLVITKPAGFFRRPTKVAWPNGQPIGSIVPQRGRYALLDANGTQLCLLGDVAHFQVGHIKKRNGNRVRRDVIQIRPGTSGPVRPLVVAAALAFDVVRGIGTNHLSSDAGSFLPIE